MLKAKSLLFICMKIGYMLKIVFNIAKNFGSQHASLR